jgi:alcohol dehydrogenase class IV
MACAFSLLDIFDLATGKEAQSSEEANCGEAFKALAKIAGRQYQAAGSDKDKVSVLREKIAGLIKTMDIPQTFADLGVKLSRQDIDSHFARSFEDPKMGNQLPRAAKENIYPYLEKKCQAECPPQ